MSEIQKKSPFIFILNNPRLLRDKVGLLRNKGWLLHNTHGVLKNSIGVIQITFGVLNQGRESLSTTVLLRNSVPHNPVLQSYAIEFLKMFGVISHAYEIIDY